jgi:hypothetical protein
MKEKALELLRDLKKFNQEVKDNYDRLVNNYDIDNLQNKAVVICLSKVCKDVDAYIILGELGYGEQSAIIIRSMFETTLWMRWVLISERNTKIFYDTPKVETKKMFNKIYGRDLVKLKNAPDPELIKKFLKEDLKHIIVPTTDDLAKDTNMEDLKALIYPQLSALSHGGYASHGEYIVKKTISPKPDYLNIIPFIPVVNNLLNDANLVAVNWLLYKKIYVMPDIRESLSKK